MSAEHEELDPDANLALQRECHALVTMRRERIEQRAELMDVVGKEADLETANEDEQGHIEDLHELIANLAWSLDQWLSAGGALPKDWRR